jgi:branched-chain amino acid aminotransferase/4-amino-4-deoxychorismate lyase
MTPTTEFAPWLGVFETLRVIDGVPLFVPEHAAELTRAASMLGLNAHLDLSKERMELSRRSGRWRWIVTMEGTTTLFSEEPNVSAVPVALSVSLVRVGSHNWDARFKTVSYLAHTQALKMAPTPEVILLNEHGEVAGAARANLFWRRGDHLFTPAHEAGCRQGVVRGFVLQRREVEMGHFSLNDLLAADEIFLTNSIKGIVSVQAVEDDTRNEFACANALRIEYVEEIAAQMKQLEERKE